MSSLNGDCPKHDANTSSINEEPKNKHYNISSDCPAEAQKRFYNVGKIIQDIKKEFEKHEKIGILKRK